MSEIPKNILIGHDSKYGGATSLYDMNATCVTKLCIRYHIYTPKSTNQPRELHAVVDTLYPRR